MRKLTILIGLFLLFELNLFCQDSIINVNRPQYNYANQISSERLKDVQPFPCSCPCSTMVKSANIHGSQSDEELFLYGGYKHVASSRSCQRIELNISACNNQSIPKLKITFPQSNDECLKKNFWIYRDDGNQEVTYCSNFDPLTGIGELFIEPSLAPCSSKTVIFYICSDNINKCEHHDYSIQVEVDGQSPQCLKTMIWHFDFLTLQKLINIDINLNDLPNNEEKKFEYKVLDLLNNVIKIGSINNLNEVQTIKKQLDNDSGFYIINIFDKGRLIYKEKFVK